MQGTFSDIVSSLRLRVSVSDFSSVVNSVSKRLDAGFYVESGTTHNKEFLPLSELVAKITSGHTPYKHNLSEGDVGFLTIEAIEPLDCDRSKERKILREHFDSGFSWKWTVMGSVLCTIKRRICNAYPILNPEDEGLAYNQDVAFMIPKNPKLTAYIATYLSSSIGKWLARKYSTEQMNPYLSVSNLKQIPITVPSEGLQLEIDATVRRAFSKRKESKDLYKEAETHLLKELGFPDHQIKNGNIDIKSSEDIRTFKRFDAEFFQPKYDEITERIRNYHNGFDTIGNLVEIVTGQVRPLNENVYRYCELADIDPELGLVNWYSKIQWQELPSRARMKVAKGDVIVSSLAGSSDKVALITDDGDDLIASTGFFVLRPKKISVETTLILMKLPFMQEVVRRMARGMILSATNQDDFKKLLLPILDERIQEKISFLVVNSHEAHKQSKELLEQAKRAVEIFVEKTEEDAIMFLKALN